MNRAAIVACAVFAGCFHPTGVDPSLLSSSSDPSSSVDMLSSGGSEVGTGDASETSTTTGGSVSSTGGAASSTSSNTATGGGCGDGNVEDGEECDDANGVAGDGCDNCVKEFRRVFVTSKVFTGNLGGLSGADKKCQDAATVAGLPGLYKAWLSVVGESPMERFVHSSVPYRQIDGVEVAKDWDDLTDEQLAAAIVVSELNGPAGTGVHSCAPIVITVWTGTSASGSAVDGSYFCSDWTGMGEGITGRGGAADSAWTQACIAKCDDQAALYCFEQ